jgi:hypothetical protein
VSPGLVGIEDARHEPSRVAANGADRTRPAYFAF